MQGSSAVKRAMKARSVVSLPKTVVTPASRSRFELSKIACRITKLSRKATPLMQPSQRLAPSLMLVTVSISLRSSVPMSPVIR